MQKILLLKASFTLILGSFTILGFLKLTDPADGDVAKRPSPVASVSDNSKLQDIFENKELSSSEKRLAAKRLIREQVVRSPKDQYLVSVILSDSPMITDLFAAKSYAESAVEQGYTFAEHMVASAEDKIRTKKGEYQASLATAKVPAPVNGKPKMTPMAAPRPVATGRTPFTPTRYAVANVRSLEVTQ